MIVGEPLPFVQEYVRKLSTHLEQHQAGRGLTGGQQGWLSFCLLCIIVTESVCWRKFVRAGLGQYTEALLSWYFRCPLSWDLLLAMSVRVVLQSFGTWEGVLVLDDTGKKRSTPFYSIGKIMKYFSLLSRYYIKADTVSYSNSKRVSVQFATNIWKTARNYMPIM